MASPRKLRNETVSGPATLTGNTLTLTALGMITVQASQAGNNVYLPASVSHTFGVTLGTPTIKSVLNAGSFAVTLAPSSYAAMFGSNLASGAAIGDASSSQTLLGAKVTIKDATGQSQTANLYFASDSQINFALPSGLATGVATVTVTTSTTESASMDVVIGPIAPALFTADSTGAGAPAANAQIIGTDGSVTVLPAFSCNPASGCVPAAIPIASGTQVYLTLYGTGIRGRSALSGVLATIGGTPATVTYAGPQGTYPALDQVNVLVPSSLAGAGVVDLKLSVDGIGANTVKVQFQ